MERKLRASLCFTNHTRGQDILHTALLLVCSGSSSGLETRLGYASQKWSFPTVTGQKAWPSSDTKIEQQNMHKKDLQ
jgi:hypothetical protein